MKSGASRPISAKSVFQVQSNNTSSSERDSIHSVLQQNYYDQLDDSDNDDVIEIESVVEDEGFIDDPIPDIVYVYSNFNRGSYL